MRKLMVVLTAVILTLSGCSPGQEVYKDRDRAIQENEIKNTIENGVERDKVEAAVKPVVNPEIVKINDIEKKFLDSSYYIEEGMIPLTIAKDYSCFVAYRIRNEDLESLNELILTGMPRQMVDLYIVDINGDKAEKIGETGFIVSHAWSGDGRMLSVVSYGSVKVLDIKMRTITEVPLEYEAESVFNTNWMEDRYELLIHLDTTANYYIYNYSTGKFLKIRGKFEENDVVYRGKAEGKDLFSIGGRVGTAKGLYTEDDTIVYDDEVIIHDMDGGRLLISHESSDKPGVTYVLEDVDINSGERRQIYKGVNLYKASYLKSAGGIIYTTFRMDDIHISYIMVHVTKDGENVTKNVPSPLYNTTPGESIIHFSTYKNGEGRVMDTASMEFIGERYENKFHNKELREIMLRALKIYCSESPDLDEIKQVFINSYDPIPQEALENILLEAQNPHTWRYMKSEMRKEIALKVKMWDNGNRASVTFGRLYFRGPHELVKMNGRWYITGFSTWPYSSERNNVYSVCTDFIRKIKSARDTGEISNKESRTQEEEKIVYVLGKTGLDFNDVEVGEIEFWSMSDPHRATPYYGYASEGRVKIVVSYQDNSTKKYHMHLSRKDAGNRWVIKGVGELSAGLWPGKES